MRNLGEPAEAHGDAGPKQSHSVMFKDRSKRQASNQSSLGTDHAAQLTTTLKETGTLEHHHFTMRKIDAAHVVLAFMRPIKPSHRNAQFATNANLSGVQRQPRS